MKYFQITALIVLLVAPQIVLNLNGSRFCKNPEGKNVDWYAVFLFPTSADPTGKLSFGYFDNTLTELKYYPYSESNFPPTKVTEFVNGTTEDFNYFFWNDDMTCKDDDDTHSAPSSKAHAKGSLIMDKENTVFLLHSLPRFPTRLTTGEVLTEIPDNAGYYGQHFLCISATSETGYTLAEWLNYINVQNNNSVKKDRVNPTANKWISNLIKNDYNTSYPNEGITKINSLGGVEFTIFSKSYRLKVIPYDTTLREYYSDDFYVRTWVRPELAPTLCDDYDILNVIDLNFGDIFKFINTKEHSKWAVAKHKNICCFADLNHVPSQQNRGGNIVCFEHRILANIMRDIIVKADQCNHKGFLQMVN